MYLYYIYVNGNLEDYTNDYMEAKEMYFKTIDEYVEDTDITLVDGETGEVLRYSGDEDED